MSDYTIQVSWSGKDGLADADPNKVISGSDFNTEFSAVQTAVNSKYDSTDLGVTLQQYDAATVKNDEATDFNDNTISRLNLKDYGEITNAIGSTGGGTQDIDLTLGNSVSATVDTSANTFTFSNPTASDEQCGFVLYLTDGNTQTVNWPSSVKWSGGTAPTLSALDIIVFTTIDGGTNWYGAVVGQSWA